jgi:hypothetical protein
MVYIKRLILVVFFLPIVCVAQSKFYVQGIVGQYSMKEMKKFQHELNEDIVSAGIASKAVTTFPMSLQVTVGYDKILSDKYSIGGYLNYAVTKGHNHYGDYSGEINFDQNVSRILLGCKAAMRLGHGFEFYGKIGVNYSMLTLESETNIYNSSTERDALEFYSIGINAEPGISWSCTYKKLLLSLQAGHEINLQGKTIFKDNKDLHLINDEGEKVIIDWSGIRLGFGVAYKLGQ